MNPNHAPSVLVPLELYESKIMEKGNEVSDTQAEGAAKKNNSKVILDMISGKPEIIEWNSDGEYNYKKGEPIKGSNLQKMLRICSDDENKENIPMGFREFYQAMADCCVPEELIRTQTGRSLLKLQKIQKLQKAKRPTILDINADERAPKKWIKLR